jgi:CheY-like chemotaxis protein
MALDSKRLVLLVEDDHDVRESMAEALEDAHYRVLQAPNGAAALEQLRRGEPLPNLILLDLMMPIMDGWQFREAQLNDKSYADIPVVVVSATARIEKPLDGISAFLKKPVNLEQLLDAVERHSSS